MLQYVEDVTTPKLFPSRSYAVATYACEFPANIDAVSGDIVMWFNGPAFTCKVAVPWIVPKVVVTVHEPAVNDV
jgi:hypothetical protein